MAIVFKHRYRLDSLIGTGAVKFRPYTVASPLPQLATPQNVTADGTVVSWDAVENATSYEVLADGTSIGTVENESGETWLLNENPNASTLPNTSINFTSNEMSFSSIRYSSSPDNPAAILYGDTYAWSTGVWISEAFRTVTFETAPTGDLLTWLQSNATKQ